MYPPRRKIRGPGQDLVQFTALCLKSPTEPPKGPADWRLGALKTASQTSRSWIHKSCSDLAVRHVRLWPIKAYLPLWCNLGDPKVVKLGKRVQIVLTHIGRHEMDHRLHEISSILIQYMGQNEPLLCTNCVSRHHQLICTGPPTDQTHSASSIRDSALGWVSPASGIWVSQTPEKAQMHSFIMISCNIKVSPRVPFWGLSVLYSYKWRG